MNNAEHQGDRIERATALRRRLLGDSRADEIAATTDAFNQPFQDYATLNVFGGTWLNGILSERELAMVNIGMLAGLGKFEEAAIYVSVALRVGVTLAEIRELIMHITGYSGTPVGRQLIKATRTILADDKIDMSALDVRPNLSGER